MNALQIGANTTIEPVTVKNLVIYAREIDPATKNYYVMDSCDIRKK